MPIRLRVALVFALALAIAFTLGSWLFLSQLSAAMLGTTDAALTARLSQAARYSEDDGGPAINTGALAPGEYIVQIVGPAGRVMHSSRQTVAYQGRAEPGPPRGDQADPAVRG